ncbi:hypothetical protein BC830DRAFT_1082663 [Chytriomyces sp. MP71]|nr:hypothetical protein BC830DRAFT_1082663 [Chytriomyces sp. MP71]
MPVSASAFKTLEEVVGTNEATENMTYIRVNAICKSLPCTLDIQHQTLKFARTCVHTSKPTLPILFTALSYIARYFQSSLCFNEDDKHVRARILFIALMTAYKYVRDRGVLNKAWIQASGELFDVEEMNQMERLFLVVLQYRLAVHDDETQSTWQCWLDELVSQAEGRSRRLRENMSLSPLTPTRMLSPKSSVASSPASPRSSTLSDSRRQSIGQVCSYLMTGIFTFEKRIVKYRFRDRFEFRTQ